MVRWGTHVFINSTVCCRDNLDELSCGCYFEEMFICKNQLFVSDVLLDLRVGVVSFIYSFFLRMCYIC